MLISRSGFPSGTQSANIEEVVLGYRVHSTNISTLKLTRQMQAVLVARAESVSRRRNGASPAARSLEQLQQALGVAQKDIDRETFQAALTWSELLAEAGLNGESEVLLQEAATSAAKVSRERRSNRAPRLYESARSPFVAHGDPFHRRSQRGWLPARRRSSWIVATSGSHASRINARSPPPRRWWSRRAKARRA